MPKVLVLIVTHNAMKWIQRCLESVILNKSVEVMVVDNASDDGTAAFISKHFPDVRVHRLLKNIGFGRANNIGLNYAVQHDFDHVFLLNQDVYVEKDTVEELVHAQQNHPEYLVISPVHKDGNGEGLDSKFAGYIEGNRVLKEAVGIYEKRGIVEKTRASQDAPSFDEWETKHKCESTQSLGVHHGTKWSEHRERSERIEDRTQARSAQSRVVNRERSERKGEEGKRNDIIIPVEFVNAAAWMLSRNALKLVGGFHPAIFMYAEDNNYVHRVHQAGFLVGVLPSASIYHDRQDRPAPEGTAKLLRNFKINATITITNPTISTREKITKTTKLLFKATGSRLKRGHPDAILLFIRMKTFSIIFSFKALKTPTPTTDFPFLETSAENK